MSGLIMSGVMNVKIGATNEKIAVILSVNLM